VKQLLGITLGVLTSVGGFVDIGDLVANSEAGSRFGIRHAWVLVVGVIGICAYAEMCGRVVAVSKRPVFDLIRERLGPRVALANLVASYLVTLLTLGAEIGGVSLALQLVSGVNYLVWLPLVGFVLWLALWRVKFELLERVLGLGGLVLVIFAVAALRLPADWPGLSAQTVHIDPPSGENWGTYWFLAVSLFASAMMPYEVFFFSSGGVEERWTSKELSQSRIDVFIGFPLGGLMALSIMVTSAQVFYPIGVSVGQLSQVALPTAIAFGKIGLGLAILGFFAATFGAAMETGLASAYSVAQYFGWAWGKRVRPVQAARFHTVLLISVLLGVAILLTTIDPVQLTEYVLVFSAVTLPLTYLPILVLANDKRYLGDKVNKRLANTVGQIYLVIVLVAALAAIPLVIITGMGG
jgi:Mn2+/Fe2+ NRAMP family transporter